MNISQPHAVLEVESQVEVVHQVLVLWQELGNELPRVCRASQCVLCAEIHPVVTQHLHLYITALRCLRIGNVRLVQDHIVGFLASMKYPTGWPSVFGSQSNTRNSAVIHSYSPIGIGWLIAHSERLIPSW